MPAMNRKATVLIVTVTKVESLAVMEAFQEATGQDSKPNPFSERLYHNLGEVNGTRVFMALSEMGTVGPGASQQVVQKGITALRPSAVILVGIAFGVNEQEQCIGDVLVSRQLWLYDLQRMGIDKIIPRGDKPHASTRLIDYFRNADLHWKEPKVRFGLILTGEKLVDNVDYREQLKAFEPEAIGGEMEGAGLYVACQDAHVDWILVKAICDWADGSKAEDEEAHQLLAARNAASFVLYTLQQAPLNPKKPSLLLFYGIVIAISLSLLIVTFLWQRYNNIFTFPPDISVINTSTPRVLASPIPEAQVPTSSLLAPVTVPPGTVEPKTIVLATTPSTIATDSVTSLPPTQPQVINFTSTPIGIQYRIRFVARPIPAEGLHNVYYSVDNGAEQFLFTAGHQVDHTFSVNFSRSIRVRADIKPGTVLHEELYINGNLIIASESADNDGLTYKVQIP